MVLPIFKKKNSNAKNQKQTEKDDNNLISSDVTGGVEKQTTKYDDTSTNDYIANLISNDISRRSRSLSRSKRSRSRERRSREKRSRERRSRERRRLESNRSSRSLERSREKSRQKRSRERRSRERRSRERRSQERQSRERRRRESNRSSRSLERSREKSRQKRSRERRLSRERRSRERRSRERRLRESLEKGRDSNNDKDRLPSRIERAAARRQVSARSLQNNNSNNNTTPQQHVKPTTTTTTPDEFERFVVDVKEQVVNNDCLSEDIVRQAQHGYVEFLNTAIDKNIIDSTKALELADLADTELKQVQTEYPNGDMSKCQENLNSVRSWLSKTRREINEAERGF